MIDKIWELLDHSLNGIINKNDNLPIIWSHQNAARIKKPYLVLSYTTNDVPDHETYDNEIDANGLRTMSSWRKAVIEIQFYDAHDSMRLASLTVSALATERSMLKQMELDCSIGTRLFLQRVPELLNASQYEDRAIYQFDFYYTERLVEDVGFIETVIVDGGYEGGHVDIEYPPIAPGIPHPDTPLRCIEVISNIPQTMWDDDTDGTYWDDYVTEWDGPTVEPYRGR